MPGQGNVPSAILLREMPFLIQKQCFYAMLLMRRKAVPQGKRLASDGKGFLHQETPKDDINERCANAGTKTRNTGACLELWGANQFIVRAHQGREMTLVTGCGSGKPAVVLHKMGKR
ncbi:hypothetical protein TRVL_03410 [Trypanosoma vivax]|nr:hypothetical protein TRVL_03410 [Trypanosoma vivax]